MEKLNNWGKNKKTIWNAVFQSNAGAYFQTYRQCVGHCRVLRGKNEWKKMAKKKWKKLRILFLKEEKKRVSSIGFLYPGLEPFGRDSIIRDSVTALVAI